MKNIIVLIFVFFAYSCTTPITATNNPVGSGRGQACSSNIFFIIPLSFDETIYTAAKNGNIVKISTVDQEYLYTGVYNRRCTIVRGFKPQQLAPAKKTVAIEPAKNVQPADPKEGYPTTQEE